MTSTDTELQELESRAATGLAEPVVRWHAEGGILGVLRGFEAVTAAAGKLEAEDDIEHDYDESKATLRRAVAEFCCDLSTASAQGRLQSVKQR
jgi:hypothetical protein